MPALRLRLAAASLFLATLCSSAATAAPTAEQRAEIGLIGTLITRAGNLFKENKFKESAEAIKEAQAKVEKLAAGADEQLLSQLQPAH